MSTLSNWIANLVPRKVALDPLTYKNAFLSFSRSSQVSNPNRRKSHFQLFSNATVRKVMRSRRLDSFTFVTSYTTNRSKKIDVTSFITLSLFLSYPHTRAHTHDTSLSLFLHFLFLCCFTIGLLCHFFAQKSLE